MSRFQLTHRVTRLPGADPETDREVLCDGRPIARVRMVENGPAAGEWMWSGYWMLPDNRGRVASLDEALAEVKRRVTRETLAALPPGK